MNGYRIRLKGKEYFIKSDYKNITDSFLEKICRRFELPSTTGIFSELRYYLQKCTLEEKRTSTGLLKWYFIKGKDFGESIPISDANNPELIIIEINK